MGIIFQNGLGIGTVPNNSGAGQWYLATGPFGYQPGWTFGTITWPMNTGGAGINYGTNDPNEILGGDTAGIYINQFDAAGNDQSILLGSIVNNSGTITFSQGPHYIIYGFTPGTFSDGLGMFGSVGWGMNSQSPLTLIASSNTSFNGYSDGDNNGGPLTYNDSGIAPNNSQLVTVTINTNPYQFVLTSDMFDNVQSYGSICGNTQGEWNGFSGFTIAQSSDLYCGVYAHLSGYTQLETAFTDAGASMDYQGHIFDVTWGNGSTVTNGVAKLAYIQNQGHQINIISVDPADTDYLTNNNNGGDSTSLIGTFNFPAIFTFRTPIINKGGWC